MNKRFLGALCISAVFLLPVVSASPALSQIENGIAQGKLFVKEGRYAEAVALFDQVKQAAADDPRSYFYSGIALIGAGHLHEAVVELRKATEKNAAEPEYALAYAETLSQLGETTAAVDVLSRFTKEQYARRLS